MSIETTRGGRQRVRLMMNGRRRSFGTKPTKAAAEDHERAVAERAERDGVETFAAVGLAWLESRERDGMRSWKTWRGFWNLHVADTALGRCAPAFVSRPMVEAWIRTMQAKTTASPCQRVAKPLSPKTIGIVISIVRQALDHAGVRPNPVAELGDVVRKATRVRGEAATREPWTYLDEEEQRALLSCEAVDEADRLILAFAIYTGLRSGEQMNLELADVHLDGDAPHVVVRFGSKGQPPKNGRVRRVYLSPRAEAAARRWLEVLPTWLTKPNREGLVFPTRTGGRCSHTKTPFRSTPWDPVARRTFVHERFPLVLAAGGITRHVRWHDLRHTCASSLVAGWWGRRWTLDEVREHLGHTSIQSTIRYAHIGENAIKRAVAETTTAAERATSSARSIAAEPENKAVSFLARPDGTTRGRGRNGSESFASFGKAGSMAGTKLERAIAEAIGDVFGPLAARARVALAAHEAGDPFAAAMLSRVLVELLERAASVGPALTRAGRGGPGL